jgi:hypothetical protein
VFLSFLFLFFAANDVYQLCMCVTREIVCKKRGGLVSRSLLLKLKGLEKFVLWGDVMDILF